MIIKFNSSNLYLKPLDYADATQLYKIANNKSLAKSVAAPNQFPYPYRLCDALKFIEYSRYSSKKGIAYNFAFYNDKTLIGAFGIFNIDRLNSKGEIGYWLGVKFWGKGFAKSGLDLILYFSFVKLRLNKVYANMFSDNLRSMNLLKSNSFTEEAEFKESIFDGKVFRDVKSYSLLNENYYGSDDILIK